MEFVKLGIGEEKECDHLLSNHKTLLRYHSPRCIHCLEMEPEWNDLRNDKSLQDNSIVVIDANVEIADKLHHKSARDVNGKGVPTIYFIYGDNMFQHNGPRKTKDIVDFALESLDRSTNIKKKKKKTKRKKSKRNTTKRKKKKCKCCGK